MPADPMSVDERRALLRRATVGIAIDAAVIDELAALPLNAHESDMMGRELARRTTERKISEETTREAEPPRAAADFLIRAFSPDAPLASRPMQMKNPAGKREESRQKAVAYLRGTEAEPETLLELANDAARYNEFGLARKLVGRARTNPEVNATEESKLKYL